MKTYLHGEAQLNKIKDLPKDAKFKKCPEDYQIIAKSEVTGNHHVIDVKEGVEFYEKDGILYLKNEVETDVRCLLKERHDNITLEPGLWEIDFQQEYDYLSEEVRRVAD